LLLPAFLGLWPHHFNLSTAMWPLPRGLLMSLYLTFVRMFARAFRPNSHSRKSPSSPGPFIQVRLHSQSCRVGCNLFLGTVVSQSHPASPVSVPRLLAPDSPVLFPAGPRVSLVI
jgi:hypothetical protein